VSRPSLRAAAGRKDHVTQVTAPLAMLRGIGVDYLRVDDLYSSLFTTVTEKNYDTVNKQRRKRIFIGFFYSLRFVHHNHHHKEIYIVRLLKALIE